VKHIGPKYINETTAEVVCQMSCENDYVW